MLRCVYGLGFVGNSKQIRLQNISVVPQNTVLFNDSIMYNIRYGNRDATDEEIFEAARAAQLHDFVLSLPKGYDTICGERGLRLSGGELQRVAIARALVKNPKIVILGASSIYYASCADCC